MAVNNPSLVGCARYIVRGMASAVRRERTVIVLLLMACRPSVDTGSDVGPAAEPVDLMEHINPFIGTGGIGYGVGGSYPGAGVPFGLVKVSPDTADANNNAPGYAHTGGYHYDDEAIRAFSHMHMQGVGIAAYGALGMMPMDGFSTERIPMAGHLQVFSHDNERAGPGWYSVEFSDVDIETTLTATAHTALHQYRFGDVETPTVLIDLAHVIGRGVVPGGEITVNPDAGTVEGWLVMDGEMGQPYPLFFSMVTDVLPSQWGVWSEDAVLEGETTASVAVPEIPEDGQVPWSGTESPPLGAWLQFDGAETVTVRVAISNVDIDGARNNLDVEHTGFSMADGQEQAMAEWADMLAPVRIGGGSERDQIIFATSLFKALQMPTLYSDADGRYRAFDDSIQQADWGGFYTDFSLWDTYRSAHPLYVLLWKEHTADMMDSLAAMARSGGSIPRWPLSNGDAGVMLGTPGTIVFAEAYLKGVVDFDVQTLHEVAIGIAMGTLDIDYGGRPDVATQEKYTYLPADMFGSSVAWSQELAISDALLSRLEAELGDPQLAEHLQERSGWWANHFRPETGFFHGRLSDGSWVDIESESQWDDVYTEGNARQYRWLVPHDPEGLFAAMGGDDIAVDYLLALFEGRRDELEELGEIGVPSAWYWHGNEPDIHAAFLFATAGRPDLTQQWVHWILDNEYDNSPAGIDGNDDAGTLAAWFVFAAMGLYPLNGTDRYVLSDPRFEWIELDVGQPGEPPLRIERQGEGEIVRIELDGEELTGVDVLHSQLKPGAVLRFIGGE